MFQRLVKALLTYLDACLKLCIDNYIHAYKHRYFLNNISNKHWIKHIHKYWNINGTHPTMNWIFDRSFTQLFQHLIGCVNNCLIEYLNM